MLLGSQLLPGIAGICPHCFSGQRCLHSPQKRQQCTLVLRLERITAQQGQAVDITGAQQSEQFCFRFLCEGLAIPEMPSLRLEATRAMVTAARHEQAHSDTRAVGDITVLYRSIVHGFTGAIPFP